MTEGRLPPASSFAERRLLPVACAMPKWRLSRLYAALIDYNILNLLKKIFYANFSA